MQQAIDFKFECECLSSVLKDLNNHDFKQITQFKNWTIEDILGHLHLFNVAADITLESRKELKDTVSKLAKIILKKEVKKTTEESHENPEDFKKIASTAS